MCCCRGDCVCGGRAAEIWRRRWTDADLDSGSHTVCSDSRRASPSYTHTTHTHTHTHTHLTLSPPNMLFSVFSLLYSRGRCYTSYTSHFKLFYFPNVIGLVQGIVRFVIAPNRKPRTERFNTRIVTPLKYIYKLNCLTIY